MKNVCFKKENVLFMVLLFILCVIPSSIGFKQDVKPLFLYDGNFLYVGGSGEDNYSRIQDAINDAVDGDTVFVFDDSSPYFENIVVDKSLNLIGENKETTVIVGFFQTNVNNVTITNFTINSGSGTCIVISSEYNNISNNIINSNILSIAIKHSSYNNISDNIINSEKDGILIDTTDEFLYSWYNIINHNIINSKEDGIILEPGWSGRCNYNIITSNIITSAEEHSGNGIRLESFFHYLSPSVCYSTKITYNVITNFNNGIYSHDGAVGGTIIEGNTISNNYNGIYASGNGWEIKNNIISNNSRGIYLPIGDCSIVGNLFENNQQIGLFIDNVQSVSILQNNFINNTKDASFITTPIMGDFFYKWKGNYWEKPCSKPYYIWGQMFIVFGRIPIIWINFDWNPAKEPYDI